MPADDADPFRITPEVRQRWDAYVQAREAAEVSTAVEDGVAAAQAFYAFVEVFMAQGAMGAGVVPMFLRGRAP